MNPNTIILIAFAVVFYVFILLPQLRRNKKQKAFKLAIKKGDKIVTNGGIHGKIAELKDLTITLDIGNGVELKIDRSAVNMEASELINKQENS